MRQLTTFMPPKKTQSLFLIRQWTIPAVLFRNHLAEMFAFVAQVHAIGAPLSEPACCLFQLPAGSETGAPTYAFAINCRNTNGKMPLCW